MLGFINIYKEKDWTSHDLVAKMRGVLRMKKIGHAGSLDPDAEGVVVLAVGPATRLLEYVEASDKTYQLTMRFGQRTDTQDLSGRVLEECPVSPETFGGLEAALAEMTGPILQIPPMYSAVKIKGQTLYKLARQGKEVDRPSRPVTIHAVSDLVGPYKEAGFYHLGLKLTCSKGTYVRTFCQDLAEKLGTCGVMTQLRRLAVGDFRLDEALRIDQLVALAGAGDVSFVEDPLVYLSLPALTVNKAQEAAALQGRAIAFDEDMLEGRTGQPGQPDQPLSRGTTEDLVLKSQTGRLLAIAQRTEEGDYVKMKKVFCHEATDK